MAAASNGLSHEGSDLDLSHSIRPGTADGGFYDLLVGD